jgi:hypothetical protein
VRRPGAERAWLARGKVSVPLKREGWVNQMIVEVDLPRLRESTIFIEGQKPLRVFKKKENEQDLEKGKRAGFRSRGHARKL